MTNNMRLLTPVSNAAMLVAMTTVTNASSLCFCVNWKIAKRMKKI